MFNVIIFLLLNTHFLYIFSIQLPLRHINLNNKNHHKHILSLNLFVNLLFILYPSFSPNYNN
jgi:hypothetical protein